MDYERCAIANDEIYLGENLANVGLAVTNYSGERAKMLIMPTPMQDFLTTYVTDCNSSWKVVGHSNIEVRGREILPGCHIKVPGNENVDATLTVDFDLDQSSCIDGYSVELNKDRMVVQNAIVEFGRPFKNIVIIMSPCNDVVHIKKTYDDTSTVLIKGGAGNDKITIGEQGTVFEDQIHAPIVIKTAKENSDYEIEVHDAGSIEEKEIALTPRGISGVHALDSATISFDPSNGIGDVKLRLGKKSTMNVSSTPNDQSVIIDTRSQTSQTDVSVVFLLLGSH